MTLPNIKEAFPNITNPELIDYLQWAIEREDLTMGHTAWGEPIPLLPPSEIIYTLINWCEELYKENQTLKGLKP